MHYCASDGWFKTQPGKGRPQAGVAAHPRQDSHNELQKKLDTANEECSRLRRAIEEIIALGDQRSVASRRMLERAEQALWGR